MTSPVPYESRVRPLIAAATPAPWEARGRYAEPAVRGPSGESVIDIGDDGACSDPDCCGGPSYHVEISDANARLIVTAVSTAAASADLAEAVRAYKDATDRREAYEAEFREMWEADKPHHSHKVAALLTVETNAYRAMLAALSRLDSAASSAGGA